MAEELLRNISKLFEIELNDDVYNNIASLDNELSDAVIEQYNILERSEQYFAKDLNRNVDQFILNCLGHLPANPSDPKKSAILKRAYVYYAPTDDNISEDIINYNEKTAEHFRDDLIFLSKKESEMYNKALFPRKVYVIYGERGIGKTFFVNHLMTKYNDYFNRKKVIFIRINLIDDFGGEDPDLVHWILSKITMVILRYYYNKPEFIEFHKLRKYLDDYIDIGYERPDERIIIREKLNKLFEIFYHNKARVTMDEKLVNESLARQILDFAINNGFSFVYVLDGFDRLDITIKHKNKFSNVYRKLQNLLHPDTKIGGCFIIVTRTETVQFMWRSMNRRFPSAFLKRTQQSKKMIIDVQFEEIVRKRLDYILDEGKREFNKDELYLLEENINQFKNYIIMHSDSKNFDGLIKDFSYIYKTNNRAKVQLMQLCYYDSLYKDSRQYKLVEAMCKQGFKFPPVLYHYCISPKDNSFIADYSFKTFDNVLLPNLFRFPYDKEYKYDISPSSNTYLLLGLRIIQNLFYSKEGWLKKKNYVVPFKSLIVKLEKEFNYQRNIIINLLDEFSEYGFINFVGNQLHIPFNMDTAIIESNPKIDFVLNVKTKKNLIYDGVS